MALIWVSANLLLVTFNVPVQSQWMITSLLEDDSGIEADLFEVLRFRSLDIDSQAGFLSYYLSQDKEAFDYQVLTPCGDFKCMNPKLKYLLKDSVREGMTVYSP